VFEPKPSCEDEEITLERCKMSKVTINLQNYFRTILVAAKSMRQPMESDFIKINHHSPEEIEIEERRSNFYESIRYGLIIVFGTAAAYVLAGKFEEHLANNNQQNEIPASNKMIPR